MEHGPDGAAALFSAPRALIVARRARDLIPALRRAEAARQGGGWIAGWLSYEAGYALEPKLAPLMPRPRPAPLAVLGVYDGPADPAAVLARAADEAAATRMSAPRPAITRAAYDRAAGRVFDYIAAGDCYQVNLTFPMRAELVEGTALGLYGALRGGAPYGGFADMGSGPAVVSLSPERFFALDAAGRITARPMKGTAPRDTDPARDAALAAGLAGSEKDRAENLMIVDLLRNDIARLARVGSVRVPDLFRVETYPSVHQMTSTVTGDLAAPATLPGLMTALFPCGSVTGAPKIRAMEIIREQEPFARGVYCGTLGWMAPDGRGDFSVAIRTLSLAGDQITLNVGGGLTHGTSAAHEWEEAGWKARFTSPAI